MRLREVVEAIRHRVEEKGTTPFRAALDADLPGTAIRHVLEGRQPRLERLIEICEALGLEFYVGPPRAPMSEIADRSSPSLPELERHTRGLVRLTVEAGGDPVPDDLWPVLAARRGEER